MNPGTSLRYSILAFASALLLGACDSENIESPVKSAASPAARSVTTITVASGLPYCSHSSADPDGDGYGFENGNSCLVVTDSNNGQTPVCLSADSDPDGDGYGYENNASCIVATYNDNSRSEGQSPVAEYIDETPINLHLVTDVILTAGQSNAFANVSRFEPDAHAEDRLDSRIIAWTQHDGWKTANPMTQIWEFDKYPAQPWDSNVASNSPGFQIARAIIDADPDRVVAFIPTSAPGQAIYHWRYGAQAYNNIRHTVETALNELPHKAQVDLIWWMQGEADGEADDYYRYSLGELINNWRGEPWYGADKYFIANETARFPVNQVFRDLRYNADVYSNYSPAEDLPTTDSVHFASPAYRAIGNRVQQVYFDMLERTR